MNNAKYWILAGALLTACSPSAEAEPEPATVAMAADATPVADTLVVYKTATCGCCKEWVKHMEENGFTVVAHDIDIVELNRMKGDVGLSPDMASCHTAIISNYAVEGHVPADLVKKLLSERPDAAGLAVPGMPMGSPGMEGPVKQRYDVLLYKRDGTRTVYATR